MSIKILLADDSITIQKVVGIIFAGEEYSLTVVDNGKSAVEKAREICPDVLLIDALMPGMSGYEVCQAVRATPAIAAKPILILTGSFEPFDENKAKECGADDYLAKPFESQQIVGKVKELFELGATRSAAPAAAAAAPAAVEPPPSFVEEAAPPFAAPAPAFVEEAAPVFAAPAAPPVEPQPAAPPADIWGAFTPDEPAAAPVAAAPAPTVEPEPFAAPFEPDVFAMVNEEPDAPAAEATAAPDQHPAQHTGSQWIPVEEQTFEFVEENVADIPAAAFASERPPVQEVAFGEIAFEEEEVTAPAAPAFEAPPAPAFEPAVTAPAFEAASVFETAVEEPVAAQPFAAPAAPVFEAPAAPAFTAPDPFAPLADPVPAFTAPAEPAAFAAAAPVEAPVAAPPAAAAAVAAVPAALTEEQLKAALAGVSKDVIERIVWEVVPDLAEALIREAIRKIKEGV